MMNLNEVKKQILNQIEKTVPIFKPSGRFEYRIRCPICGDSMKDQHDAHCYIKCSDNPNEPLLYHCFLCNSSGRVSNSFLRMLGIKSSLVSKLNVIRRNTITVSNDDHTELDLGCIDNALPQINYIQYRLGSNKFTPDDYNAMRIVCDVEKLRSCINTDNVYYSLPNNMTSISFITSDNHMLLTRNFREQSPRWRKTKLLDDGLPSYYIIKSTIDLFTLQPITINIAEGVFDIISIYQNYNTHVNNIFIASLGKNYIDALKYIISRGIVGNNVYVRVYMDDDVNVKYQQKLFKQFKWLFRSIKLFQNLIGHDYGVPIKNIKLNEYGV